jgi:hypothetical protein
MTIKNLWSLNVDEAILADTLKKKLGKNYELFFPVNSQLKDIDLIIYHLKSKKSNSIQVKGSRTYVTRRSEKIDGNASWHVIKTNSIFKPTNQIDFFIFVIHEENVLITKRKIQQHYLIIPINDFRKITKNEKKERKTGFYHYSFVVQNKKVVEINNIKNKRIDFSKYLNNFKLLEK